AAEVEDKEEPQAAEDATATYMAERQAHLQPVFHPKGPPPPPGVEINLNPGGLSDISNEEAEGAPTETASAASSMDEEQEDSNLTPGAVPTAPTEVPAAACDIPAHLYISPPPWAAEEAEESEHGFEDDPPMETNSAAATATGEDHGMVEGAAGAADARRLDLELDDPDFRPELTSGSAEESSEDSFLNTLDFGYAKGTKD
ncbi:yfiI, partial [Symbiodinium sp. CCMP2456]